MEPAASSRQPPTLAQRLATRHDFLAAEVRRTRPRLVVFCTEPQPGLRALGAFEFLLLPEDGWAEAASQTSYRASCRASLLRHVGLTQELADAGAALVLGAAARIFELHGTDLEASLCARDARDPACAAKVCAALGLSRDAYWRAVVGPRRLQLPSGRRLPL